MDRWTTIWKYEMAYERRDQHVNGETNIWTNGITQKEGPTYRQMAALRQRDAVLGRQTILADCVFGGRVRESGRKFAILQNTDNATHHC